MAWLYVVIGGIIEIGWAIGLKYAHGFTVLLPSLITIGLIIISFYFFTQAMRRLPIGTAYAVYTGIGSAGTALIGILFMGEPASLLRIACIILLVGSIIGLKLVTAEEPEPAQQPARVK